MKIKELFQKPIDRNIEGVIKADDRSNLIREVEEYVITNEIRKKLAVFFDAYLKEGESNGVWLSGFFGSGKSHLLKMLSLLLEDWQDGDCSIQDSFVSKLHEDQILSAEIKKAVKIPARCILFNIDQKADLVSKQQTDALLSVFVKVFDEFCGYYGKQGYIAKLERDLDKRGIFQSFKNEYKAISGKDWETGREEAILESGNISQAYQKVTKNSAIDMNVLNSYRQEYKVSIEDFAHMVWDYIQTQEDDFRLNFFVDEVGQFIAENTKLMLNLQTIAESLATICKGRAWLIVTSQEDLDSVVGEMKQSTGNDFSKIKGRFKTPINLTSANVDEVIQKRLLLKKQSSLDILSELYHTHEHSFKTMFDFVDGAQRYRIFEDKENFIFSYPIIPYQFSLFQKAITELSVNHAFQGRHSSVGERSMLGVFQEVVKYISEENTGKIATFDLMFDGIRSSIVSQIQSAIINAENNLGDAFATKVLKVLFMLKYVKDFRATVANVSILMIPSFAADISALRAKVQEALSKLENQTYIQRNSDLYEYLTNEEKDVEQQIKNTSVDNINMLDKLEELTFSSAQIIKNPKIRYLDNKQDFPYTRRIDAKQYGKEYEIAIQIITPQSEYYDFEDDRQTTAHALGKPELTVVLPADKRWWDDLKISLQTEKCYTQNYNSMQSESAKRILNEKRELNKERLIQVKNRLLELLCSAKLYAGGEPVDVEIADANQRIIEAFQIVIAKVYPNLKMLKGVSYTEQDIGRYLTYSQLETEFAETLGEAEQEVFSYITSQKREGRKSTIQSLMYHFGKKPYGWGFYAILCQVAKLYALSRIEVFADGATLENSDLGKALTNTKRHGTLILQTQQEYTPGQLRRLRELYHLLFDKPVDEKDAKLLARKFSSTLSEQVEILERIFVLKDSYTFVRDIKPILETYRNAIGKHHSWYYTELLKQEDELAKAKVDLVDPIRAFINSPQQTIYDQVGKFIKEQDPNFSYLDSDKVQELRQSFADPLVYKGNRIQKLKTLYDILASKLDRLVSEEKKSALKELDQLKLDLAELPDYEQQASKHQGEISSKFAAAKMRLEESTLIAVIKDHINRFIDQDYTKLIELLSPEPIIPPGPATTQKPEKRDVSLRDIITKTDSGIIESQAELERYLAKIKVAMLKEIKQGNRIIIDLSRS